MLMTYISFKSTRKKAIEITGALERFSPYRGFASNYEQNSCLGP